MVYIYVLDQRRCHAKSGSQGVNKICHVSLVIFTRSSGLQVVANLDILLSL